MDALVNARVQSGDALIEERAVLLDAGRIAAVVAKDEVPPAARRCDLGGGILASGLIDLQTNGGGGVLFNHAPTIQTIERIARAHRRFGTTGFLPTLITADRRTMAAAASAVDEAIAQRVPGVLGIHFEGPHLHPAKKGVHDVRHLRAPNPEDLDLLTSLRSGRTLVTLAPECVAPDVIRSLVARGAMVSAGHTNATCAELCTAFDAGVRGVTHLFNAMSSFGSREPGAVGTALAERACWCGIIVDGHHVHPASVRAAWHAKGSRRLHLVTDAMPPVGAAMDHFLLGGERIEVRAGRCTTADGRLAGAALDMAGAVRNAVRLAGIPLTDALAMASACPAGLLGIAHERGRIAPGALADLVLLDDELEVRATWIEGEVEWVAPG